MKRLKKFNESSEYPGRLNKFYEEQMSNPSTENIFSVLFSHMNLWYLPYKTNVGEMKITIKFRKDTIHTGIMEILSKLEKDMKKAGYYEPSVELDCRRKQIIINEI